MIICYYCGKNIHSGEYKNRIKLYWSKSDENFDELIFFHHSCFKIWKSRGFINPDGKFGSKCSSSLGFADSGKAIKDDK